jgi:hypothetical protein
MLELVPAVAGCAKNARPAMSMHDFYLSIIWATDLKLKSLHVCNIVFSLLWGTRG